MRKLIIAPHWARLPDVPELVADLAKQLIVVIRGALLALSHLQAQDLLVDVNLRQQWKNYRK